MVDEKALIDFLSRDLANGKEISTIGRKGNLIEAGIVDSLGIMKLLMFLENHASISVSDEDLTPENFESVDAILLLIGRKKLGEGV